MILPDHEHLDVVGIKQLFYLNVFEDFLSLFLRVLNLFLIDLLQSIQKQDVHVMNEY